MENLLDSLEATGRAGESVQDSGTPGHGTTLKRDTVYAVLGGIVYVILSAHLQGILAAVQGVALTFFILGMVGVSQSKG